MRIALNLDLWHSSSFPFPYSAPPQDGMALGHSWQAEMGDFSQAPKDTTPPMYLTRTGIRSRSSIKARDGTTHRNGSQSTTTGVPGGSGAVSIRSFKA
jgi:hypothetical protein